MRFDERFIDELKARLRPSDVIGRTVKLKRQGREYVGDILTSVARLGEQIAAHFDQRGGQWGDGLGRDKHRLRQGLFSRLHQQGIGHDLWNFTVELAQQVGHGADQLRARRSGRGSRTVPPRPRRAQDAPDEFADEVQCNIRFRPGSCRIPALQIIPRVATGGPAL